MTRIICSVVHEESIGQHPDFLIVFHFPWEWKTISRVIHGFFYLFDWFLVSFQMMIKMMIVRKLIGILIVCSLMQGSLNKYLEVRKYNINSMFSTSLSFINHINGIWRWYTLIKACLLDTVGRRLIISLKDIRPNSYLKF